MELTKKMIIKAAIRHTSGEKTCEGCPFISCDKIGSTKQCLDIFADFIAKDGNIKENEPAPMGVDTSSEKISVDNLETADTTAVSMSKYNTKLKKCQELLEASVKDTLEIYNVMTEPEQRAFDMGTAFRSLLSGLNELEEMILND